MMDEQKAINRLVCGNTAHSCKSDYIKLAIKALEKQVAKKPSFEGDGYDPDGNLVYDTWICPSCEKHYEVDYEEYDYCPSCGQRIDWSDQDGLE